ncbi:MAG: glycine-rich domain-containing protein [Aestuariivirga sp.]
MLDFSNLANTRNGADIQIFSTATGLSFQTWTKPRGKSMMMITALSAGAGGGGGMSGLASTPRGGGGGGGSGAISRLILPIDFMSDTLYVQIGQGGLGGAAGAVGSNGTNTYVSNSTSTYLLECVALACGGVATGGGAGSISAAGAAGAAAAATSWPGGAAGHALYNVVGGNPGMIGGAQTGAAGADQYLGYATITPFTGGAGGGGVTTTDFAGGACHANGATWLADLTGGVTVGGRGSDGYLNLRPFGGLGGSGGGSNNSGTGGAGGNGATGCGGGGGGAGVTGGTGGRGGNGLVVIACW